MIDHARGAVLQLAHPRIQERDEIGNAIGHWDVERVARADLAALGAQPALGGELLGVQRFRQRNDLGQKVDLFIEAGPAAEEHVDDLVEIEQPERQLEIARIEDLRTVAEAAAVFVVDVENEEPQVGAGLDDLLQQ